MYCPTCGKQISDNSRFCLHCGNPITQVTKQDEIDTPVNWEYRWFSWEYKEGQGGHYDLHGAYGVTWTEQSARLFFWNNMQASVLPAFQKELDEGWQPLSEIGPSAVLFQKHDTWLELAGVKVKLRKHRTTALQDYESALIGRWQRTQEEAAKGFWMSRYRLTEHIANMLVSAFAFMDDRTFVGEAANPKGSLSGTYGFGDQSHIIMTLDSPGLRSTKAEVVNDELIYCPENLRPPRLLYFTKVR